MNNYLSVHPGLKVNNSLTDTKHPVEYFSLILKCEDVYAE